MVFVLEDAKPVALAMLTCRMPEEVQVGGVWTPPPLRGKGYARAVVAGALRTARMGGVERAVLFTDTENVSARRAYEALGFAVIGDYGIAFFDP